MRGIPFCLVIAMGNGIQQADIIKTEDRKWKPGGGEGLKAEGGKKMSFSIR
jgi:hypothetical protein